MDETFTTYIGGLSYSTDKPGLENFLSENGVKAVNVRIVSRDGESKGFGYADFETKEEYEKCIALHGLELDGRTLRINEADKPNASRGGRGGRGGFGSGGRGRGRGGGGGSFGGNFDNETPTKLLMVKNLSWNTDNEGLQNVFPEATDARVCRFSDTGKSRGFAFVEFTDVDAATSAREKNQGSEIDGREVNIVFAEPRR